MSKNRIGKGWFVPAVAVTVCLLAGCRGEDDVAARYELEKAMWKAEQWRKRAVLDPLTEDVGAYHRAVRLYEEVLAKEPFYSDTHVGATETRRDFERLFLKSKIALAELYFTELETYAGVTYPAAITGRRDLLFTRHFGLRLGKIKLIYGASPVDSLELRCAEAFERVVEDPALWSSDVCPGDTLSLLPLWLSRVELGRGEARDYDYTWAAEDFYSRVIRYRPGTRCARDARSRRAELRVLEERFAHALGDIDTLIASAAASLDRADLLLWKGEILAYGLGHEEEAERIMREVAAAHPRSAAERGAVLNLAELVSRRGQIEEAARMLRDLEMDPTTPAETAAAAMFLRALQAERRGDRQQALQLLWRVCRLEPSTRAAAVAPWMIVERALESADPTVRNRTLEEVGRFYLEAMGKRAGHLQHPHVLKDLLTESYLAAGMPEAVAQLLEAHAVNWTPDNGCVGLYKSALIYLRLLHEEEKGVRILQKCLDLFPTSRYAWIVRALLDESSPTSDDPRQG